MAIPSGIYEDVRGSFHSTCLFQRARRSHNAQHTWLTHQETIVYEFCRQHSKTPTPQDMCHAKGSPVYKTWIIISVALLSTAREVRALRWLHHLDRGIEAVEGGKIALRWDYDLEGQTLDEIEWVDMSTSETIARKFAPPRKPSVNPEFPRFNVSNTEKATLYISPVKRSDKGQYSCKVLSTEDMWGNTGRVNLDVLFKPKVFAAASAPSSVVEGGSVHLGAVVDGNPRPHVAWVSPSGRVLTNKTGKWNHTISNITRAVSGPYRCVATNAVGEDVRVVHVAVRFPVAVVHPKQGATVTATENHTAVLVCRAEGVPTPRMSWTSPDGTVQLENKSEEVNLTMASVSRHSAGSYTCNATNELGSDSVSVALDVWYAPRLLSVRPTASPTFRELDSVLLGAAVEGNPPPYVAWISPRGVTLQNSTSKLNYTVHNVTREDRGRYRCIATNQVGNHRGEVVIEIKFPATAVAPIQNVSVLEGKQATLVCRVDGFPAPRILWSGPDGTVLQNLTGVPNLSLTNVSRRIAGFYRCNAANELGSAEAAGARLVVLYPPLLKFCPGNLTVDERQNVSLRAWAEGQPPPSVAWVSPVGTVLQNKTERSNFTITNITRERRGSYRCIARNSVGTDVKRFFIDVRFAASVVLLTEEPGTEVATALLCRGEGNPTPQVTLFDSTGEVRGNATGETRISLENAEAGNYTCRASNRLGQSERSYYVDRSEINEYTEVQGSLTTTDPFKKEYSNTSSDEFQAYARNLSRAIMEEVSKGPYTARGVQIDRMRNGSVIVDFTLAFRGVVDPRNATITLREAVRRGRVGPISVLTDSFAQLHQPTSSPNATSGKTEEPPSSCLCKNGGVCRNGKCECSIIRAGKDCSEWSVWFMVVVTVAALLVVLLIACLTWRRPGACSKRSANIHQPTSVPETALKNLAFDQDTEKSQQGTDGTVDKDTTSIEEAKG